ncbi:putative DNA-binding WGR domain protein [Chitinophaga dinghuensis]|uniref:Putative DNA-binding WGR domain protein n=1 Tax=Chitinophaga dinghuensis TaxID=1539050 RepID=A0A327W982_9BACT|nr:WGR domain-containing protein [Chitinophaga dinghuensis]RAJ87277.1 putative DNA-binding WGR domain protein [Chitinophaga dinghuensis]
MGLKLPQRKKYMLHMTNNFIYQDNNSHKFWNITINGTEMTVTFGKVGTQGQLQVKSFATEEECRKASEKLIAEKVKKGYVLQQAPDTPANNSLQIPLPLFEDILALSEYLQTQWPDKVEIHPSSAAHITRMEEKAGFSLPAPFREFWLCKGYYYFDKDDFLCAVYAYNDNADNATTPFDLLQMFLNIYRVNSEWITQEKHFLSHCWMLGMIMDDEDKRFVISDPAGQIHNIHIPTPFKDINDDILAADFASLIAVKGNFQLPATEEEEPEYPDTAEEDADQELRVFLNKYQLEKISYEETLERLGVSHLFDYWESPENATWTTEEYETESEYFEQYDRIYFCDGDIEIEGDLKIPNDDMDLLVVKGNMTIKGKVVSYYGAGVQYYVAGNTTVDYIYLSDFQKTCGDETIRYVALALGQDDEVVHTMAHRTINAPYFFSWFYNLNCFEFAAETLITAIYNEEDLSAYGSENALLAWHEYAYAFRPEFYSQITESHHNGFELQTSRIYEALLHHQPVLQDGVTLEGIKLVSKGIRLKTQDDAVGAYQCFKQATIVSPGDYLAYYNAGKCLFEQKAYAQAMEYFAKGIPYTPEKVAYEFNCMQEAALCAAITSAYDKAVQWAEMTLQKSPSAHFALRILGEVAIKQQQLKAAQTYLEQSIAIKSIFSNNWLLGLIYHLNGDTKQAESCYKTAHSKNSKARPYTEYTDLSFIYGEPVAVNWDTQQQSPVKDQQYWNQFFDKTLSQFGPGLYKSTGYFPDQWLSHKVTTIPAEFRTIEMLQSLLQHQTNGEFDVDGGILQLFNVELLTPELALMAVSRASACHYSHIPTHLLTSQIFQAHPQGIDLSYIPEEQKTYDLCFQAVSVNQYNYDYIPAAFKDEQMNIALIAGGVLDNTSGKVLPSKYHTSEYIQKAIDLGIKIITRIPTKLVDKTVFQYAENKYGQDPEWPFIVEQYDRNTWKYGARYDIEWVGKIILKHGLDVFKHIEPDRIQQQIYQYIKKHLGHLPAFEELVKKYGWDVRKAVSYETPKEFDYNTFSKVWACFWDEDFIINAITANSPDSSERIYAVPQQYLTQKICEIAVKRNSYDFQFVPKKYITEEMCETACGQDYGTALEYVPLHMRTEKVCQLALGRDAENIRFIPLALRDAGLCTRVMLRNSNYLQFIPYAHYSSIFETLLKKHKSHFYADMLLLNRGLGLIVEKDYTEARTFLLQVEKAEEVRDHYWHQALYYTGWSYHLEGNAQQAAEYWQRAQDQAQAAKINKEYWFTFPYAAFQLVPVNDVYEFSKDDFNAQMTEASLLISSNNYAPAIALLAQVEKLLADSQCSEMPLWAQVWDHQRYALYEAGQQEESLTLCRKMVTELGKIQLWDYLESFNPIRAALRNAHNNLAYHYYQTAGNIQEVKEGLQHIKTTMKTIAPIEEKSVLNPFYETQVLLWHKAMQFDPAYQKDLQKGIEKIDKLKLKEKGFISETYLNLIG